MGRTNDFCIGCHCAGCTGYTGCIGPGDSGYHCAGCTGYTGCIGPGDSLDNVVNREEEGSCGTVYVPNYRNPLHQKRADTIPPATTAKELLFHSGLSIALSMAAASLPRK